MIDNTMTLEHFKYNAGKAFSYLEEDPSREIILLRNGVPSMRIRALSEIEQLEIMAREARKKDLELHSRLRKAKEAAGYKD